MASNYHVASVRNSMVDIQKTNLWLVEIEIPSGLDYSVEGSEIPTTKSLQVRAKSCKIPGRRMNTIETSFYGGMKSTYAGTEDMGNKTLDIEFYEFEDQHVTKTINVWLNNIFNSMDSTNGKGGHGLAGQKFPNNLRGSAYAANIKLKVMGMDGNPLDKTFIFHTAWPTSIGDVSLNYDNSSGVENTVTFQYDWWEMKNS